MSTHNDAVLEMATRDGNRRPSFTRTTDRHAVGAPGIEARWTSSAKTGVGTALGNESHVWFTLSHGICNEIYYPRLDQACTRDMGLIVTDGVDFFSEEKRDTDSTIHWLDDGVPAFRLINICRSGRYRIEKEVLTDPHRDTLLQYVRFVPHDGQMSDYRLYALLAPHLGNRGSGNTAWVGEFDDEPLLFAQQDGSALALACSTAWMKRSVGYVGSSDGWQDLSQHKKMVWEYARAENGNVAQTGEIDLGESKGEFVLAIGFGRNANQAAQNAIASLREDFRKTKREYIAGWQEWKRLHILPEKNALSPTDLSHSSLAVLRTHESKRKAGGIIASLSIPWGASMGDDDLGGYHLVWSRDIVEAAGGLLAAGAHEDARRVLSFLHSTQQSDGHWPQNMWLDGSPYQSGIQLDETALPILLVDLAYRERALDKAALAQFWPMVRRAAGYLLRNGPASPEDRWEEDPGYSIFTVAAEIAALLAAADLADLNRETRVGNYFRETADVWNSCIEDWLYASHADWCQEYNVEGYYVRIAPKNAGEGASDLRKSVRVKNVASNDSQQAIHLISPDALALVRFGLRAADDVRIRNTVKIIDELLKVETPSGPSWHRYNGDGYGEHKDGAPFDGTGIGRAWPLLTGERAHYELAAGQTQKAEHLQATMESFANEGGLISEQVWDTTDIPEHELRFGRPSGSAMPLVWAHAEYLKLRRSLRDGRLFDLPPQTVRRYITEKTGSTRVIWRFDHKVSSMPVGKVLRIETQAPAVIHWSANDWKTTKDETSQDTSVGIFVADLPTAGLPEGSQIKITFYWPEAGRWEGADFGIRVGS